MKTHIRALRPEFDDDTWVLLMKDPVFSLSNLVWEGDPDEYYAHPKRMRTDGVIGSCFLSRTIESGIECFYPNTTYVHPDFRGKGMGKKMYRTCLALIREAGYHKDEVEFRRHDGLRWGSTSYSAQQVYHALRRRGYIKRIRTGRYHIKKWPRATHITLED